MLNKMKNRLLYFYKEYLEYKKILLLEKLNMCKKSFDEEDAKFETQRNSKD